MNTTDINKIFEGEKQPAHRAYDVRVTLNRSGSGRFRIRFGFLNDAVKAFDNKPYMQASQVEKLADYIYFKPVDKKVPGAQKLCTNSNSTTTNLYASITPSEAAEKIYRAKWVGKTFKIQLDEECGLYYISQREAL